MSIPGFRSIMERVLPPPLSRLPFRTAAVYVLLGLALVASGGCADLPSPAVPTVTQPAPAPLPTATPRPPALEVTALELMQAPLPGSWSVLGLLENRSNTVREVLRVRIELRDADGVPIAEQAALPLLRVLPPGQQTPFSAAFSAAVPVAEARAEAFSRAAPSGALAEPIVELEQQFILPDGRLAIVGRVTNDTSSWLELSALGLLALETNGRPRLLAEAGHRPTRLSPLETVPFLALAERNPGHVQWRAFAGGAFTDEGPGGIELLGPPELRFTPQGVPFVIGEIVNRAQHPQQANLLVVLRGGAQLLTLQAIQPPIVLGPGERLGFSARNFPGAALRGVRDGADQVQVEIRAEAEPARSLPLPLEVRVELFYTVGSATFVRGSLVNPQQFALESPVVLGEIRQVNGKLWTAGWVVLPDVIPPGQQLEFVLELPQDAPLDLTTLELDLRAFGTGASE